ncbi:S8 family serine peptidase [Kitasatospora sp. NPDC002551]|uniref:S8 family serine peptidase n=1 Tax=unclassified Kitasatospora TaxID=2633591 RepID=UPI003331B672
MRRTSRTGRLTAALLGAVLVGTVTAPAAWARPAGPPADTVPGGAGGPGRLVQVTLITGDRVTARVGADGTVAPVGVQPGPGREGMAFNRVPGVPGSLTLVPQDADQPLRAGRLDPRLFDIAGLIAQGYDDGGSRELPLIVGRAPGEGPAGLAATAPPPGATAVRELESVHGTALRADKARTGELWQRLGPAAAAPTVAPDPAGTAELAPGVAKIWLDGKVGAALDRSTAQIGAPEAWRSGLTGRGVKVAVLDSGVDGGHPDLAGSIGESSDFTGGATGVKDADGHGTHVASIVGGDGAAAEGRFKGVAPDAELLVGKVLDDEGRGQESWVLQGMEWAAARAPIVNLSLTGAPTDGTDPMAQAVNTLSERYGTLFVAAAGNSGRAGTVGSPGSADAALTVGAVDRADRLAPLSSQGPRTGDHAVKPDITAPGTDIVAARAAGTTGQNPVGDHYTAISGTSMAAPHAAGAAALLLQQHPDWRGPQLKAALTSSARPAADQSSYQQGAGRLDVARATAQTVLATAESTGIRFTDRQTGPAVTRTITYRNTGTEPVTLDLAGSVTAADGSAGPAGALTVAPARLTVPAGGSGLATVTVDPAAVAAGATLSGRVTAGVTGAGAGGGQAGPAAPSVTTAFALSREAVHHEITVQAVDRDGAPLGPGDWLTGRSQLHLVDLDTRAAYELRFTDGTATVRVPEGRYNLAGKLVTPARNGRSTTGTLLLQPELELRGDSRLSIDARQGRQITVTVPDRDAVPFSLSAAFCYRSAKGTPCAGEVLSLGTPGNLYVIPSARPAAGTVDFSVQSLQSGPARKDGRLPDRYDLFLHTTGALPDPAFRVAPADLATVSTLYGAQSAGTSGVMSSYAEADGVGGLTYGEPTFPLPAARTEYFTTRGQQRETYFGQEAGPGGELFPPAVTQSGVVPCDAGASCVEWWNGAVTGPGLAAGKDGAASMARTSDHFMTVFPQLFTDAAPGHYGSPLPLRMNDTVQLELARDGQRIGAADTPAATFAVPPTEGSYRLTAKAIRAEAWALSSTVEAAWTFRSGPVAAGPGGSVRTAPLPIGVVRLSAPVDAESRAPRDRHTVTARVERQSGAPAPATTRLTAEVSFDGGASWQNASVSGAGQGAHRIIVDPPAQGEADVSLRVTAQDADGSAVEQTILHAYRLKP